METLYTLDGNTKREMTLQETQDHVDYQQQVEQQKQKEIAADKIKAEARQAVLDKLGLTQAEAQALLG